MTTDNPESSPDRAVVMANIVDSLGICGGTVPSDELHFWREVATYHGLGVAALELQPLMRAVLRELGDDEWDDDYLDDEGFGTLALYETLAGLLQESLSKSNEPRDEALEDEDEGIGSLPPTFEVMASITTFGLKSVVDWIQDGTLVLSPEWQRSFVWKAKKQKRLIESILLGLPIPSFLLYHDSKSGKKYVIDGRQRLETVARFVSRKEAKGEPKVRFRTFSAKEEGWGPGERLNLAANKYYDQLPPEFRSAFESASLVLATFRDINMGKLYQIFRRYNTGAVSLNAAEIRNAVYQASPLHQMLFRLGGEHKPDPEYQDDHERRVSEDLRQTMGGKRQRYGAYDFIGRYFAFAYMERGSVANATVAFMDRYQDRPDRVEDFRQEFIRVFQRATEDWYQPFPLTEPRESGAFHAFLATLQLVSTKRLLEHEASGVVSSDQVQDYLLHSWSGFAENRLEKKQNSTLFWNSQKTWISKIEDELALPRKYPEWDWRTDLGASAVVESGE